jgi:two-component system response regulator AtoC
VAEDFTSLTRHAIPAGFRLPAEGVSLEDVEKQLLVQALERTRGNQTHAGQLLGINRDQVRYRIEKFGLERPQLVHGSASRQVEAAAPA